MEENKMEETKVPSPATKKTLPPLVVMALGLLSTVIVVGLVGVGVVAMKVKAVSHNPTIIKMAKVLHLPAASVNGDSVPYSEYIEDMDTLNHFYAAQADQLPPVSQTELSDMTISRLVAYNIIENLAKDYDVTVSDADIAAKKQELLSSFPSEAVAEAELQKSYAWDFDTYTRKVIVPVLREEKLQAAFEASTDPSLNDYLVDEIHARHVVLVVADLKDDEKVKKQAQALLDRLNKGEDFEKIAKEVNSDETKAQGGDLGWIRKGDLPKDFETTAFGLEKGAVSGLVKTTYGYHIIRLEDKRIVKDFTLFMDKKIGAADIKIRININNPFTELQARLRGETPEAPDTGAMEVEADAVEATTSAQ